MRELVLAFGGALVVANVAVRVKERRRATDDTGARPNRRVLALNLCVGLLLAAWGLASLVTQR